MNKGHKQPKNKSIMKTRLALVTFLILFSFLLSAQNQKYSVNEEAEYHEEQVERGSKFEVGFHFGPAWASGDAKDFAKSGNAFSLDLGANSGNFYIGTELTITSWKDFVDSQEAEDANFEETTFLWLANARLFMGEGNVQPYIGLGTDLITLADYMISPDDDDDCYDSNHHHNDELDYNAWIVPSFGIRWKMGPDVSGNIGLTGNFSGNYSFVRLQLGIVF
jgi:hypothetical protein